MEVVTQQLLNGNRINHLQLPTVDDWVLLFAKDHTVRLCSLQRGVVRVEVEMAGLKSGSFPVRGTMSPDGAFVACGSEGGELLVWGASDGKPTSKEVAPQVQLAGPVMDVVWGEKHHVLACCALADQAPPLLVFAGGDPHRVPAQRPPLAAPQQAEELTARPVPLREAPWDAPVPPLDASPGGRHRSSSVDLPLWQQRQQRQQRQQLQPPPPLSRPPPTLPNGHGIAPVAAAAWANAWVHSDAGGSGRSAVASDEKRRMKEQILSSLCDKKSSHNLEHQLATGGLRLPGGL